MFPNMSVNCDYEYKTIHVFINKLNDLQACIMKAYHNNIAYKYS